MSVQMCEGIWRTRCGQRVVVTECDPVDGQRWTDGVHHYSDNGSFWGEGRESPHDLVSFVGLLPDSSQRAPVSRPAETESTTGVEGGVANDPGRVIYDLEQRLAAVIKQNEQAQRYVSDANEAINEKTAEIDRLRAELEQSQGVRKSLAAEVERLQTELRGYAAETHRQLRTLQESHNKATATLQAEQRGEREGFRTAIGMILEALK